MYSSRSLPVFQRNKLLASCYLGLEFDPGDGSILFLQNISKLAGYTVTAQKIALFNVFA
jgi:hypothetical protein